MTATQVLFRAAQLLLLESKKVAGVAAAYTAADLSGEGLMIKKGKKVFHKATIG